MPRLRQVPKFEATPEVVAMYERLFDERDPVAEPGTATGTPGNWWTVFALVPEVFDHATRGFGLFSSKDRALQPRYRELGLTRSGFVQGSKFVFSQHCKAARAAGLSEQEVAALPAWSAQSAVFDDKDRAVLAYVDGLIGNDGRVPDGVFDALKSNFSDEEILELTYAVASYGMHAAICRALQLEYDDVPDRVFEEPMPGQGPGQNTDDERDVMSDISR